MALSKYHMHGMQGLMDIFRRMVFKEVRVSLYINDFLYMGSCDMMKDKFKVAMMNEFEMKYLGLMKYFLGMKVYQGKECNEYAKEV